MTEPRNITSLPGIKVTKLEDLEGLRKVIAEWKPGRSEIDTCPKCGADDPKLYVKEWVERELRDRPVGNQPLLIRLKCCHYECQECGRSFQPEHPGLRDNSTLTEALFEHIWKRTLSTEPHKHIARATGTHESTVRKCFEWAKRHLNKETPPLTIIGAVGIDEVHLGPVGKCTIITAVSKQEKRPSRIVEVLPDALQTTIKGFLDRLGGGSTAVPVVIDMQSYLKSTIQKSRSSTVIVVDRFHIVRRANLAVGSASSSLINDGLEQRWRNRKADLEGEEVEVGEQRDILDVTEGSHPVDQMEAAWKTAKRFQAIFDMDISRDEAKERLSHWRRHLPDPLRPHFKKVTKPLSNWWDEILNYFKYRYTNGFNESVNAIAKRFDRRGGEYSFETIRFKLLNGAASKRRADRKAPARLKDYSRILYGFPASSRGIEALQDDTEYARPPRQHLRWHRITRKLKVVSSSLPMKD